MCFLSNQLFVGDLSDHKKPEKTGPDVQKKKSKYPKWNQKNKAGYTLL